MDGDFSSVTFICSKTDDISLTEATDSLGIEGQVAPLWEESDSQIKLQSSLKVEFKVIEEDRAARGQALEKVEVEIEVWEELQNKADDGEVVFRSSNNKKKKDAKVAR